MFAIFVTGGKQYKVSEGDVIFVEKLGVAEGEKVTFDNVLAVCGEKIGDFEICDGNCAECDEDCE